MGTVLAAEIGCRRPDGCADAFRLVMSALESVDAAMSVYHDSEITRINNHAGKSDYLQPVERDTEHVLRAAVATAEQSNGHFDITVKLLGDLYGFYRQSGQAPGTLPAAAELSRLTALVGYRDLTVETGRAGLKRPGMQIDLGGIAKGFALDKAAAGLIKAGYNAFTLNFGGQILAYGIATPVAVKNPQHSGKDLLRCEITAGSVSVSAQSERFRSAGGKKIGHLLNPHTGRSEDRNLVTVVYHQQAMLADAWSTALFFTDAVEFNALTRKQALVAYKLDADGKLQASDAAKTAALCRSTTQNN